MSTTSTVRTSPPAAAPRQSAAITVAGLGILLFAVVAYAIVDHQLGPKWALLATTASVVTCIVVWVAAVAIARQQRIEAKLDTLIARSEHRS